MGRYIGLLLKLVFILMLMIVNDMFPDIVCFKKHTLK